MHLQSTVLLLSLISFATHISAEQPQPQYPLRNWLSKVSSYISATGWRNPGDVLEGSKAVTAAAVAARRIVPLTLDNWKSTLVGDAATTGLSDDAGNVQEWWVLITGGNRTCYGQCGRVEQAWNVSLARLGGGSLNGCGLLIRTTSSAALGNRGSLYRPAGQDASSGHPRLRPFASSLQHLVRDAAFSLAYPRATAAAGRHHGQTAHGDLHHTAQRLDRHGAAVDRPSPVGIVEGTRALPWRLSSLRWLAGHVRTQRPLGLPAVLVRHGARLDLDAAAYSRQLEGHVSFCLLDSEVFFFRRRT